jgi:hypothetical protein
MRNHQSATFQYTILNMTSKALNETDAELANFAAWRSLVIGDLNQFEVLECRLRLAAIFYTNISVTQNTLHVRDDIAVPLVLTSQFNANMNIYKPVGSQFPPELQFGFDGADLAATSNLLQDILTADVTYPFGQETGIVPDVLSKGNLSQITKNIALGISEHIRTGRNSTTVDGIAHKFETYIHVEWPWLILPVAVVAGAATLLSCSIVLCSRRNAALWKSSNLALLLHSVDGLTGRELTSQGFPPLTRLDVLAQETRAFRGGNMEFFAHFRS